MRIENFWKNSCNKVEEDSRFHKAALWVLLFEKNEIKKCKKYISWMVIKFWPATNENRRYKSGDA